MISIKIWKKQSLNIHPKTKNHEIENSRIPKQNIDKE